MDGAFVGFGMVALGFVWACGVVWVSRLKKGKKKENQRQHQPLNIDTNTPPQVS